MMNKKLDPILRHDMLKMYLRKADDVLLNKNPTKEDFKYLGEITDQVLNWDDAILACKYAEHISTCCGDKFRPYIKLNELQDRVIKSNDEELMYMFASEVSGADIKKIMCHIHDRYLYNKLKRDITPFDELTR